MNAQESLNDKDKEQLAYFRETLETPAMKWALNRAKESRPPIAVAGESIQQNADRAAVAHGWELALAFLEKELPNMDRNSSEKSGYLPTNED